MCGRYRQSSPAETLKTLFGITDMSYTVGGILSPTMKAPVIRDGKADLMSWGYVPSWSKEASAQRLINARAETLAEKPSFRESLQKRRCLIPADGFFEWSAVAKQKRAFEFTLQDNAPFAFAGIWDAWQNPDTGEVSENFAIITRAADEKVLPVHDRMPVILTGKSDFARWLSSPALDFTAPELMMSPVEMPRKAVGDSRQISLL